MTDFTNHSAKEVFVMRTSSKSGSCLMLPYTSIISGKFKLLCTFAWLNATFDIRIQLLQVELCARLKSKFACLAQFPFKIRHQVVWARGGCSLVAHCFYNYVTSFECRSCHSLKLFTS